MSKRDDPRARTAGHGSGRRRKLTPASTALSEITAALHVIREVGADIKADGPETLYIDTIFADPMGEGHGSRVMGIICAICDRLDVTLSGHIVHDEDECREDDCFAHDEDLDDEAPLSPSSDDLKRWYSRFGFEIMRGDWKSEVRRPPHPMVLDADRDADPEPSPARGHGM